MPINLEKQRSRTYKNSVTPYYKFRLASWGICLRVSPIGGSVSFTKGSNGAADKRRPWMLISSIFGSLLYSGLCGGACPQDLWSDLCLCALVSMSSF